MRVSSLRALALSTILSALASVACAQAPAASPAAPDEAPASPAPAAPAGPLEPPAIPAETLTPPYATPPAFEPGLAPAPGLAAPALPRAVEARDEALSRDLNALAGRGGGRILNGSLQLAAGVALVTIGAVLGDEIGRSLLILFGAGALAHGITVLSLPDAAKLAARYNHMPRLTAEQVRARIYLGEESLGRLARAGRRARIIDGAIDMSVSAASLPIFWWLERRADPHYHYGDSALDYVSLTLVGLAFASGLASALIPTEAERRAQGYRELVDLLEQQSPGALERLARRTSFQLAASSRQLLIGARVRF